MDGGAWEATYSPRGRKESDTTAQLTLYFTTGRTQYKMRAPQEIGIIWKWELIWAYGIKSGFTEVKYKINCVKLLNSNSENLTEGLGSLDLIL